MKREFMFQYPQADYKTQCNT